MRCLCGSDRLRLAHRYLAPPHGETRFAALAGQPYERAYFECLACGHYLSDPPTLPEDFYQGGYAAGTYLDETTLRATYDRIRALPDDRSDNRARVRRIAERMRRQGRDPALVTLLDIGAGLGVFAAGMKEIGTRVTAVEADETYVRHAREVVGVEGVHGDFRGLVGRRFDWIVLNKVLEHVPDPVGMLRDAAGLLAPGGSAYLELPDAPGALAVGFEREEFFIEHLHVFSPRSASILAERAGYAVDELASIREPSGKFTIFSFLRTA